VTPGFAADDVLVYDVKLADRIEPYLIAAASVRRNDDVAFVCDCLMPEGVQGVALRHYSFPDRWWAANVSLNLDGTLRTEFGPDTAYAYDCDITTPHFAAFGAICNIDLKLDVFVLPDGRTSIVTDHDDFAEAIARGWIDDADRVGAEAALAELTALIDAGGLRPFLEDVFPFRSVDDAAEVTILEHRSVADIPVLDHWRQVRTKR
jgi:hypothetical protein